MSWRHLAATALGIAAVALAGAAPATAEDEPGPPTDDPAVEARVSHQLDREGFHEHDVRVRVVDGVVTLSGQVETPRDKEGAAGVARGVRGVKEVVNDLLVGDVDPEELPPTGSELPPVSQ